MKIIPDSSEMNLKRKYSGKFTKNLPFLNKMLNLKNKNSFKKSPEKWKAFISASYATQTGKQR
jgi:hypothetical protein